MNRTALSSPRGSSPKSSSRTSAPGSPARSRLRKRAPHGWQERFLTLLPAIREQARFCFRHLARDVREDLIEEAIANAFVAYARLVEQDKEDLAYATPLVRYAVAQIRAGRRVGSSQNVRDVFSDSCQHKHRITVDRLDRYNEEDQAWREVVVEDRRCGPAEIAVMRIDFQAWLASLPRRQRRIALRLAAGEPTSQVVRLFNLSAARISQLRRELQAAWEELQGELRSQAA